MRKRDENKRTIVTLWFRSPSLHLARLEPAVFEYTSKKKRMSSKLLRSMELKGRDKIRWRDKIRRDKIRRGKIKRDKIRRKGKVKKTKQTSVPTLDTEIYVYGTYVFLLTPPRWCWLVKIFLHPPAGAFLKGNDTKKEKFSKKLSGLYSSRDYLRSRSHQISPQHPSRVLLPSSWGFRFAYFLGGVWPPSEGFVW